MTIPPSLADYDGTENAGEWLAMLPFCPNIAVSDYPATPVPPVFHSSPDSLLEQAKHD